MCQYLSASDEISHAGESVSVQLQYEAGSGFDPYVSNVKKDLNVKSEPVGSEGDKAVFAGGAADRFKGKRFFDCYCWEKNGRRRTDNCGKSNCAKSQ